MSLRRYLKNPPRCPHAFTNEYLVIQTCPWCGEKRQLILVPIIDPPSVQSFEHPPLNYYKYGEYPRFISPVQDRCRSELMWVKL